MEIETRMDAIKAKMDEVGEGVSDTEDKIMENNEAEKKRKRK